MTHPEFSCLSCGSGSLRRSYSGTWRDLPKMLVGTYAFRCLTCKRRSFINVWLYSKQKYAKCPQCLSLEIVGRTHKPHRPSLWKRLLLGMGANRYRCLVCHHRFLSFKHPEMYTAKTVLEERAAVTAA